MKNPPRPVAGVSTIDAINNLPLVVTVIVGTKGENISRNYPTNVRVSTTESELALETVFLCFQIRSLDRDRFPAKPAGKLTINKMTEIETTVRYCLGL